MQLEEKKISKIDIRLVIPLWHTMKYPTSHLEFSQYTYERAYQENTSDKWVIPWYSARQRCITNLYHAIENTVAKTAINVTHARRMMGRLVVIPSNIQRLSCILIRCISMAWY